jgi:cell wall assembly regulator SMI1
MNTKVKTFWAEYKIIIKSKAPHMINYLNDGASDEQIENLLVTISNDIPSDYLDFLRIFNGNSQSTHMLLGYNILSCEEVIRDWKIWCELEEKGEFTHDDAWPDKGVQKKWYSKGWIPIADDGMGNFVCIDLNPTKDGTHGQIIFLDHELEERPILYSSFIELLESYIKMLQKNEFVFCEDYDGFIIAEDCI